MAKLTFAIFMARWVDKRGERLKSFVHGFLPFAILPDFVIGFARTRDRVESPREFSRVHVPRPDVTGRRALWHLPGTGTCYRKVFINGGWR